LGPWGYGLGFAVLLILSLKVVGPAREYLGRPDHPAIVLDEVLGLLVALAGVPATWTAVAAGFLLFRLLDILKPFPISWLGKGPGDGLEVVADDVTAGMLARVILEVGLVVGGGPGT
jgi:phosphatidylglycerophosphatase A